jgi:hypothetical protein
LTDSTGAPLGSKVITFNGTGASNLPSAVTNPDGTFLASGASPNSVGVGWTVQAHYAGDVGLAGTDSNIRTYETTKHATTLTIAVTPNPVASGGTYTVSGVLRDFTLGVTLSSMTITITADSPITISDVVTDSVGKYKTPNLTAPGAGSYAIQSHFAENSLYKASNSSVKTLNVT